MAKDPTFENKEELAPKSISEQEGWIDSHLKQLRTAIRERLDQEDTKEATLEDVAAAIADVCPIKSHRSEKRSYMLAFFSSLPAIAWVSAVLAVIFGYLGSIDGANASQGWLDIAKIFAGAVVGASGTAIRSR